MDKLKTFHKILHNRDQLQPPYMRPSKFTIMETLDKILIKFSDKSGGYQEIKKLKKHK
jgi:ribosomal protein L17